jgi:hypothetical protein
VQSRSPFLDGARALLAREHDPATGANNVGNAPAGFLLLERAKTRRWSAAQALAEPLARWGSEKVENAPVSFPFHRPMLSQLPEATQRQNI